MASERSRLPGALPGIVHYGQALRALRLAAGRMGTGAACERPLLALEHSDVVVYAVAALLCLLTALPFWLASADGVVAGPGGVPAPRLWDALGRASAMLSEGPWPPAAGYGPFSPLWTWTLAVPYAVLGWAGLSTLALAKLLAWLAGVVVAIGIYNVALAATGRRWPGALAVGLLALDPALALGRVSGSEAPLVAALTVFAVLSALRGRGAWLRWLMAALVLARPDGALIVALVLAVLAVELLWRGGELTADPARDVATLARLFLPAAVVLGLWGLYGLAVSGTPLRPLCGEPAATGPSGGAAVGLWNGFLALDPAVAAGFAVVTLAAWAWSAWLFGRVWGARGALPTLVPVVLLASALAGGPTDGAPWTYDAWRLAEPALPWLALALALGLSAAGRFIWARSGPGMPATLRAWPMERVVACLPLVWWLLSAGLGLARASSDYAWGSRNVGELPAAAGAWVPLNAPPGARIGVAPGAEAVRALDRRPTRELASDPNGSWLPARQAAQDEGLIYLVAYHNTPPTAWPMAREVLRLATARNVSLPGPELGVYRLDWSLARLDKRDPTLLDVGGYAMLDEVDVGDDASETRHFYASATRAAPVRTESGAPAGWLADEGRTQELGRGTESFVVAAKPGQDLVIAVRYDAASRGSLRFDVEGGDPVELRLRDCGYQLCEDAVVAMASGRVKKSALRVDVAFVGGTGRATTYHYWALARG